MSAPPVRRKCGWSGMAVITVGWKGVRISWHICNTAGWSGVRMGRHNGQRCRWELSQEGPA